VEVESQVAYVGVLYFQLWKFTQYNLSVEKLQITLNWISLEIANKTSSLN